jgi:hypothetical protein
VGIADIRTGQPVFTGNVKHFAAVPSLLIEGFAV